MLYEAMTTFRCHVQCVKYIDLIKQIHYQKEHNYVV